MKSASNLLERLNTLPFFGKNTVYQLGKQLGLAPASVKTYISRYMKNREVLQLKNGLYVAAHYFSSHGNDVSYVYYLANVLRTPSYVSSWAALQYYGLTTEAIKVVTSVTSKVGRSYVTKAGNFVYQSIQKPLFKDFVLVRGKFDFFMATPAKAVFDTLYFKTHQFRGIELNKVWKLIDELRIDLDEMEEKDRSSLRAMLNTYFYE